MVAKTSPAAGGAPMAWRRQHSTTASCTRSCASASNRVCCRANSRNLGPCKASHRSHSEFPDVASLQPLFTRFQPLKRRPRRLLSKKVSPTTCTPTGRILRPKCCNQSYPRRSAQEHPRGQADCLPAIRLCVNQGHRRSRADEPGFRSRKARGSEATIERETFRVEGQAIFSASQSKPSAPRVVFLLARTRLQV